MRINIDHLSEKHLVELVKRVAGEVIIFQGYNRDWNPTSLDEYR